MARFSSLCWRGNRPSITGTSARAARERGTAIGFFVVASGAWCRKATAAIGTAGRAPWGRAERSECVARWQSSGAVHWKMSSDVRGQEQRPGEGIGGSDRSVPFFHFPFSLPAVRFHGPPPSTSQVRSMSPPTCTTYVVPWGGPALHEPSDDVEKKEGEA